MAELIFYRRGEELMRVSLDRPRTSLGRGPQNDVAIPDVQVSRQQAILERRGDKLFLVDQSGRGTVVGGKSCAEAEICEGSEMMLGEWRAVYRSTARGYEGPTEVRGGRLDGTAVLARVETGAVGPIQLRVRGTSSERLLLFEQDELSIGKDEENQLVLDDRFVSSFHARLIKTGRAFLLRDLGSTNGTYLNGARIREGEVELGSHIRVGETEILLEPVPGAHDGERQGFEGIVGHDPAMQQLFELIDRVAPAGVSVTIFGETGTGKELVARAIHVRSQRGSKPFVPVNCAAISKELIESELFGHEKGAFTGADRARTGAFEEAHGGTLFLDEIGELPVDLQAKLLRALELGEIKRVGSSRTTQVDVRLVAATNRDLLAESRRGGFREDLYYRLCVFPLTLPPLRRRLHDLPLLTDYFVRKFAPPGVTVKVGQAAREKLASHPFPGNIRELRNVVSRAMLLRQGALIEETHIIFDAPFTEPRGLMAGERIDDDYHLYLPGRSVEECRLEIMLRALRRQGGNKTAAAKELQVSRSTLIKLVAGGSGSDA